MRYEAVERVTVVFRFLPDNFWKKNSASVKSVLSHAFCCFIACMDDLTAQVSQQATLMLGTIHDAALRSVISCLEYQFDTGEFLSMTIFCSIRNQLYIFFDLTP